MLHTSNGIGIGHWYR